MTISEINDIYQRITTLRTKKLPVRLSMILGRNIKRLEDVVKDSEEMRKQLITEYAEKDDNGEIIVDENHNVRIKDISMFTEQLKDLMNTNIDITLDKIQIEDIEKCDIDRYDPVTPEEMTALDLMMDEQYHE